MLKIKNKNNKKIIRMCDMKPLQVGYTQSNGKDHVLVMRTASKDTFEVMDLKNPGENEYWSSNSKKPVRLLNPGEEVTVILYNEIIQESK